MADFPAVIQRWCDEWCARRLAPCLVSCDPLALTAAMRVVYHAIAAPLGASLVPATRVAAHLWVRPPMGSHDAGNGTPRRPPAVSTLARPNGAGPAGGWRMERAQPCAASAPCDVPAGDGSWRTGVAINPPSRQCKVHGILCRFRLCLPTCADGRCARRVPRGHDTPGRVPRASNSGPYRRSSLIQRRIPLFPLS